MSDRESTPSRNTDSLQVQRALRAIQDGTASESHFRELYEATSSACQASLGRWGCKEDRIQDITQDTFISVYRNLEGFRGDSSFSTYVLVTLRNKWKNELRSRGTLRGQAEENTMVLTPTGAQNEEEDMPFKIEPRSMIQDPEERTLAQEKFDGLNKALDQLPSRMRRCISLKIQGLSYQEIADLMEITTETVKKQLQSARKRLYQAVGHLLQVFGIWVFGG